MIGGNGVGEPMYDGACSEAYVGGTTDLRHNGNFVLSIIYLPAASR